MQGALDQLPTSEVASKTSGAVKGCPADKQVVKTSHHSFYQDAVKQRQLSLQSPAILQRSQPLEVAYVPEGYTLEVYESWNATANKH